MSPRRSSLAEAGELNESVGVASIAKLIVPPEFVTSMMVKER